MWSSTFAACLGLSLQRRRIERLSLMRGLAVRGLLFARCALARVDRDQPFPWVPEDLVVKWRVAGDRELEAAVEVVVDLGRQRVVDVKLFVKTDREEVGAVAELQVSEIEASLDPVSLVEIQLDLFSNVPRHD